MSNSECLDINPDFLSFDSAQSIHRASNGSLLSPSDPASALSSEKEQRRTSKASNKGISSFINKLYSLIKDPRHQDLINWSPNGTSFYIRNIKKFADQVLPEYFKHGNFSSFVRLLNMYGFHKVNKSARGQRGNENEIWEFSHPKFQRDRPDQLKDVRRKTMDSEVLRREAGDFQTVCSTLQISQADLQRQFQALEENFSNLLQGFEETRKMQSQQQFLLSQLAERQGMSLSQLYDTTDPSTPAAAACLSPVSFQKAVNTPLPPSPAPSFQLDPSSVMLDGSKVPATPPSQQQQQQDQQQRPRSFVL